MPWLFMFSFLLITIELVFLLSPFITTETRMISTILFLFYIYYLYIYILYMYIYYIYICIIYICLGFLSHRATPMVIHFFGIFHEIKPPAVSRAGCHDLHAGLPISGPGVAVGLDTVGLGIRFWTHWLIGG